jgi:hypoxanthine phosphoribosyltransferase
LKSVKEESVRPLVFDILLDQNRISRRVSEIGQQINKDYAGQSLILVGVMKGCIVFLSDLMRQITLPVEVEFISAASYRKGIKREEDIIISGGVTVSLKNRHVLIVEGIVDTGRTARMIIDKLSKLEPASIEIVTLLDKPGSHRHKIDIKYRGFAIGNEFVIGYGLDNAQKFRNLPYIGKVRE